VTDVLTFSYEPFPTLIADIVICIPVAKESSFQKKISIEHNLSHLLVHGTLHAIGFDHVDKKEAELMENIEIEILNFFKISNPYD
jgi:probable rRNA maturation factor